jgi:hypothetical protein
VVHPHALVLGAGADARHIGSLRRGRRVVVGGRRVALPDSDVEVARWWSPRPVLGPIDRVQLHAASRSVAAAVAERAAALPEVEADRLHGLIDRLRLRDQASAAAAAHGLLGLGAGSTPTGDDLLAGLFSGVRLLGSALGDPAAERVMKLADDVGRDVVAASDRATAAVSAALLRHAVRGEVCRPAGRLLVALAREPRGHVLSDAVDGLLAVGSSSGRDLALGLLAASDLLTGDLATADPVVPSFAATTSTIATGRA